MITPYKGRTLDPDQPVEVYRNLHREGTWYSIRQGGLVIGHTQEITLLECTFVVHEAGRQRVIAEGRKNVHAWVRGTVTESPVGADSWYAAKYNPRKAATFTDSYGNPLTEATVVVLFRGGVDFANQYWF